MQNNGIPRVSTLPSKPELREDLQISRKISMNDTMRTPQMIIGDGSVLKMDQLLTLDFDDHQSNALLFITSHPSKCDEHRKGKLQLHQRKTLAQKQIESPELEELEEERENSQRQGLTGESLLASNGLDKLLDALTGVSRGHKKKLQREVYKFQNSIERSLTFEDEVLPEPAPSPPIDPDKSSMQRVKLDIRGAVESMVTLPARQLAPELNPLGFSPLKIDLDEDDRVASIAPKRSRGGRQTLRALELDIAQVKKEEKTVAASFDFSATGRLQTQGFEINQCEAHEKKSASTANTVSTKDYLLLLEELGHGAGGKVYKALYMPTFMLVAVKVIRVYDQKKRHQMVRELKSLYVNFVPLATATLPSTFAATSSVAQAACKELVVFYDAYTNPEVGSVSIVLEYMDGGSLEDYVQSVTEGDEENAGCLSEEKIANIAMCGLKGLAFLHEHHQLHRDIKLSNMLINHQGQVKISDFGISRDLESTLAKATTFTGTLLYMAPERISGGMYSYPSDLWSFGLAIMACVIGKLPVPTSDGYWGVVHAVQEQPSPRLQDYGDHFSPELCDFLDQCLHKNPLYRPPAATLLEHPFIKKNYLPSEQATVDLSRGRQPLTTKLLERSRKDMISIAVKAQSWCRDHVNAFRRLSYINEGTEVQSTSSRSKIEALAKQLRLPVDEVAPHFTFLDEYCK
ncbi:unnamed protein product [Peronospora belbahrii]|uniref:Protein kinase domain-containing protein n=1 Tax=Peronospora belbahrii TaxID=622444 RepID=A0AAU9LGS8_9STRA|nr:unnamed protein product [Peronospora belbahrii]